MQERRFDFAERLCAMFDGGDDPSLFYIVGKHLSAMTPDDRVAAARSLVRPQRWKAFPSTESWLHLQAGLDGPLPAETAEAILAAKAWRSLISDLAASDDKGAAELLATFAALVPAKVSASFLAAIEPLPMMIKHRATTYHQLLARLPMSPSSAAE
jgi:hypothetical protein